MRLPRILSGGWQPWQSTNNLFQGPMLSSEWLSAFAPVGSPRGPESWAAHGAGVFFHKPPLLWLITANHVVDHVGPELVSVLVTQSGGGKVIVVPVGMIVAQHGLGWI